MEELAEAVNVSPERLEEEEEEPFFFA